jgi:hypothetical protein
MTPEQRKAWIGLVEVAKRNLSMPITDERFRMAQQVFLAADVELKRLREAVEWACGEMNKGNRSVRDWHLTVDETRRRAGKE